MARINDKTVIESLAQVAQVEPTAEASARAIARARQAVLQQPPVKRRPSTAMTLVAVGCAAAIVLLLVPVWNHFQQGREKPVANGPAVAGPAARGNVQALPGSLPTTEEPEPGDPGTQSGVLPPGGPAKPGSGPAGPGVPTQREVAANKPRDSSLRLKKEEGDEVLLELIERFPEFARVDVGGSQVTDAGLAHLKKMKKLTSVGLDGAQLTPEAIRYLQALPGLKSLDVSWATDESIAHLKELPNLKRLGLGYAGKLTDAGIASLAEMKGLQRLELTNNDMVGDAGLAHLKGLTDLRELTLNGTGITDDGLESLQEMKHLERLDLSRTSISDAGLRHLAGMTSLKQLQLGDTRVTDAGLVHLEGLTELWSLGLYRLAVTDAGMEHLKPLKKLMILGLNGTRVSDAAVEELRRGLPHKTPDNFGKR